MKMSKNCSLCDKKPSLPIKAICGDVFCYLCLKTYGNQSCPNCNGVLPSNNVLYDEFDRNVFWLYSSKFGATWWCYEKQHNEQLECIYDDYLNRKNLKKNNDKNDSDIEMKLTKKYVSKKIKDNTNQKKYDEYEFSDDDSDSVYFDEEDKDIKVEEKKESEKKLSYIIAIGGNIDFKIDFDNMMQVNIMDSNKKRSIKRIEFGKNDKNFIEKLKNDHCVIGIAGIKF